MSNKITSMDTSDNGDHLAMVDVSGAANYMNMSATNSYSWQSQLLVGSGAESVVISHDGKTIVISISSADIR